jgi:hypothetical protein
MKPFVGRLLTGAPLPDALDTDRGGRQPVLDQKPRSRREIPIRHFPEPLIVASARLQETSSSTIEQLRLVNTLCWAKNFADGRC